MGLRNSVAAAKVVEETNIYLTEPQKGLELCSNIISKGEIDYQEKMEIINSILDQFMQISQSDSNTTGVKTYKHLLELKEDLINILNFPKLENHFTVAVGGSFSAGKSTFLNKVLGLDGILPTDTNPTTSISSYVTKGEKNSYMGLNTFNNIIDLDKEAIQAISHAFNKKYGVSFSHILKLISIEQKGLKYDNIVFLDTPGYSKTDDVKKENNIDENIAREHLRTTDFLIWLLDCQTPISDTDMNFLETLNLKHPILVVLNKADKKLPEDVQKQIEKSKENLINRGISTYDVVGYSSSKDIEFSSTGNVVKTFLEQISSASTGTKILDRAKKIFDTYINYYDSQLVEYRTTRGVLNRMIMEDAIDDTFMGEIRKLSSKRVKQIKDIEKSKKQVEILAKELRGTIEYLLNAKGIHIEESNKTFKFDTVLYEQKQDHKKINKTFRFPASLQLKDHNELIAYKNLNEIEAKVYKVSSLGVFVKINGISGDIMISKSKIIKESEIIDINKIFEIEDSVTVQITDKRKCVVIKECEI